MVFVFVVSEEAAGAMAEEAAAACQEEPIHVRPALASDPMLASTAAVGLLDGLYSRKRASGTDARSGAAVWRSFAA